MTDQGIGAAVLRREDARFITGKARYVDDINRPGQVYAHFLRSPHAHAEIAKLDKAKAETVDGVIAVLTGEDVA
ncbi:MAG TPA: hypothetical protein VK844_06295, partial [Hyphomicrobiales bacterium]|nr:hypothetical protein [Hyphomicrobiales bacterium]